jgi:CRP-like cAMP-binding protein
VRAAALYLLGEHGGADDPTLARLSKDEHRVVREVASCLQERMREGMCAPDRSRPLTTLEKMLALHDAPLLCRLAPEGLADLARSSIETAYAPGSTLFQEGELGDEVLILLAGEVTSFQDGGAEEHIISAEAPGRLIGETVGLAPAPRSATVCAGAEGARVLCLHGDAFRKAMNAHPAMTSEVIRLFAQRLHGRIEGEEPSSIPSGATRMA